MPTVGSLGECAALGTAVCWTASAVAFTHAVRHVGALPVNLMRLLMAAGLLVVVGQSAFGQLVPVVPAQAWGYLAVSGLVGFFLGDLCLFQSYLMIGPRLGLLVLSLWPPLAALLAWPLLGERLCGREWLGIAITLAGVATVVLERPARVAAGTHQHYLQGTLLAAAAAVCQAFGFVISKPGMHVLDPLGAEPVRASLQATQIRIIAAMAGFVLMFALLHRWGTVATAFRHRRAVAWTAMGSVAGPCLGVALALLALQYAKAGIAATIMAIAPILILPHAVLVDRERVRLLTVAGAVVALAGLAVLAV